MPEEKFPQFGDEVRRLFVEENKTAKEISGLFPISEKQIGIWINQYGWRLEKEKKRREVQSDESTVKDIMRKFLADLSTKEPGQITPGDLDKLAKLSSTLRTIQSMLDPKAATVFVMQRFLEFVSKKNKDLHGNLLEIIPEFFDIMGKQ